MSEEVMPAGFADSVPEFDEMQRYRALLEEKHEGTVHSDECPGLDLQVADKGDEVVVYCDGAGGVVLDRKTREGTLRAERENNDD